MATGTCPGLEERESWEQPAQEAGMGGPGPRASPVEEVVQREVRTTWARAVSSGWPWKVDPAQRPT